MTPKFITQTIKLIKSNSPEILTALSVSGVVTTSYLTGKASFAAVSVITENEKEKPPWGDPKERFKERAKQVWKMYIPAGISGVFTVGCIIGSSRANSRRTTAAFTAYSLTERAFSEYKEKVVEQIGKGKEQAIRDELAQERITKYPPTSREVIVIGTGHVLCCELLTGRYFKSDMETLRKAQNDINVKIVSDLYVTLESFYDLVGLLHTTNSDLTGWDSHKLMEMHFSTVLTENGEPCLAFEYNYTKPLYG